METVSVVIPLFNKAQYIQRAVASVLVQTYERWELLVIDDGSTDGSAQVVTGFSDSRIRLIQQANAGVSAARNLGVRAAQTALVAFLDADDAWAPTFLETVLRLYTQYPHAGMYATACEWREPQRVFVPPISHIPAAPWEGLMPSYFKSAATGYLPITASSVMVPQAVFEQIGYFPVGIRHGEDHDMWARIALRYPVAFSWVVGAVYFRDTQGRACETAPAEKEPPFIAFAEGLIKEGAIQADIVQDLKEYIVGVRLYLAQECVFRINRPHLARQYLKHSSHTVLFRKKWYWLRLFLFFPYPLRISFRKMKRWLFPAQSLLG